MSGIFGVFTRNNYNVEDALCPLKKYNSIYGNEEPSEFSFKAGSMGCFRNCLSEKNTHKIILTEENKYAVIDAVIYNRNEIIKKLKAEGDSEYNFDELSDDSLLFRYISAFGFDSLSEVNGDFSGIIYDSNKDRLTAFRDHMGIRPLFFYMDDDIAVFSTDLIGIAEIPQIDSSINEEHFYLKMMGYNDLSLCETEFKKIRCISPASWCEFNKEKTAGWNYSEHSYWELGKAKIRYSSMQEYQDELRNLITDSIKRRLDVTSGTVGCELSGGLDSSVIAILINRLGREGKYFSWSWSPEDFPLIDGEDERKVILDICRQENIACNFSKKLDFNPSITLEDILSSTGVPYLNTKYIEEGSKLVKELGANVMFTGQGGDEGVSHRSNPYELWKNGEYLAFFKTIWRNQNGKSLPLTRFGYNVFRQFFVVHPGLKKEFHKRHNMEEFLNTSFKNELKNTPHPSHTFAYDPIAYIMHGGERHRLDNAAYQGAKQGIQYMFPFLDYRVIDYAVSIPRECYQNGRGNRWIYRKAFDDIMPESLRNVKYKDSPSVRDYFPQNLSEIRDYYLKLKDEILEYLDHDYWSKYLSFEEIEKISLKEKYTEYDFYVFSEQIDNLIYCALIQNMTKNSIEDK